MTVTSIVHHGVTAEHGYGNPVLPFLWRDAKNVVWLRTNHDGHTRDVAVMGNAEFPTGIITHSVTNTVAAWQRRLTRMEWIELRNV